MSEFDDNESYWTGVPRRAKQAARVKPQPPTLTPLVKTPLVKTCHCGCGDTELGPAGWSSQGGHDSAALHYVMWTKYGLTEDFIRAHGYGSGPGLEPIPQGDER